MQKGVDKELVKKICEQSELNKITIDKKEKRIKDKLNGLKDSQVII